MHLVELTYCLFGSKIKALFKKVKSMEVTKMIAENGSILLAAINVAWSGNHLLQAERARL